MAYSNLAYLVIANASLFFPRPICSAVASSTAAHFTPKSEQSLEEQADRILSTSDVWGAGCMKEHERWEKQGGERESLSIAAHSALRC